MIFHLINDRNFETLEHTTQEYPLPFASTEKLLTCLVYYP
jgi:hypothetical protein